MPDETIAKALDSDAPLSAAVHQRDLNDQLAKDLGWRDAALVGRTVTIDRPRAALYAFWRDVRNLALFMENVESVTPIDAERSRWVVKGPGGASVAWDSVLTEAVEDTALAWESAQGADIKNAGRVLFRDAPPGRGTQVTVTLVYEPPGGDLGKLIAKLFQREPKIQARRELRRFKQLMETGEIATATPFNAAPQG